jgi:uncharacterized Ntn-hydrolase superfamily protein
MKQVLFSTLLILGLSAQAQDTFSIIAVDPETGDIGSAGASCINLNNSNWDQWITDIIPGRGGVNSQAYVCIPNVNLENAMDRMSAGDSPQEIIDWLMLNDACGSQNFNPEYRQYGIVDFDLAGNPRSAGFTGSLTDDYKEDRQGPTYSIQGNILLDQSVIDQMEFNFNNTNGTLADRLMAALQGANFPGADNRCLASGTSSRAAYMVVYHADDIPGAPYLRLVVPAQSPGIEPIDLLQGLYDDFTTLGIDDQQKLHDIKLWPNPVNQQINLELAPEVILQQVEVRNILGQKQSINQSGTALEVAHLSPGLYLLEVYTSAGKRILRFVKS